MDADVIIGTESTACESNWKWSKLAARTGFSPVRVGIIHPPAGRTLHTTIQQGIRHPLDGHGRFPRCFRRWRSISLPDSSMLCRLVFAAILGVGAYTSAILANTTPEIAFHPGMSPWVGIWLGALVAGLFGLGLGILTLRLRGIFRSHHVLVRRHRSYGACSQYDLVDSRAVGNGTRHPVHDHFQHSVLLCRPGDAVSGLRKPESDPLALISAWHSGPWDRTTRQPAPPGSIQPRYRVFNFTISSFFAGWLGGFYAHYFGSLTPTAVMDTNKTVEVLGDRIHRWSWQLVGRHRDRLSDGVLPGITTLALG